MAQQFPKAARLAPRTARVRSKTDPDVITSHDNKWLKLFRAALRGSGPAGGELIGVEGPSWCEEALRSGLEAEALLVSATGEREHGRILARGQ